MQTADYASAREHLESQGVSEALISMAEEFREAYPVAPEMESRVAAPSSVYYGREVWEASLAAILAGENLLLSGPKATGKNVLAENLAWVLGRPLFNISFHVNTDSASLIGTDTFVDNEVRLRRGPVYQCADYGGFGVFDEINMAKNDAASVLHSCLDHRRVVDVPGYERVRLHDATRFIATMNYGYAGTRELNEALVSRFMVVDMPGVDRDTLAKILLAQNPDLRPEALEQFAGLFLDLQLKAQNSEITTKPVDLRGMLSAIRMMRIGLPPAAATRMGITNKTFDGFERDLIDDVVMTRIPAGWTRDDVFE